MTKVFKVLNVVVFTSYLLVIVIFLIFRKEINGNVIMRSKFGMIMITIVSCTFLLYYYGYHVNKVVKSIKLKRLYITLLIFSLIYIVVHGSILFVRTVYGTSV